MQIYNVNATDELPYIVMDLIDGRSLQEHVQKNGPLETKDVVRVAHQIAAGLAAAHEQGPVHRDIKPANILLEKDVSRVMITDFGLARAADDVAMTQTGWLAGTPHYMSPEQASGKDIDHRSDLFSLGSVLYFIATGREPFRADKPLAVLQKIGSSDPIAPRRINSDIPDTLDRIINSLLEKDAFNRPASASGLHRTLTQYLAHLQHPQSNLRPSVRASAKQRSRRPILLAIASTVMFVCAIVFATQAYQQKGNDSSIGNGTDSENVEYGTGIDGRRDTDANTQPESTVHAGSVPEGIDPYEVWATEAVNLDRDLRELELRSHQAMPMFQPNEVMEIPQPGIELPADSHREDLSETERSESG